MFLTDKLFTFSQTVGFDWNKKQTTFYFVTVLLQDCAVCKQTQCRMSLSLHLPLVSFALKKKQSIIFRYPTHYHVLYIGYWQIVSQQQILG